MNQDEYIKLYSNEKPMLLSWGNYIKDIINKELKNKNIVLKKFLKVPAEPRVKEIDSLLAKAFMRGKTYEDPYYDITDKVGIRYVVLLLEDISIIESIIQSRGEWSYSKDVDFETMKRDSPEFFTYQSVHYVIRNKEEISCGDDIILEGTPCEIQIRTLLQHAYAELSHTTIYKKNIDVNPLVKRKLARSMALIEATDELFKEVQRSLFEEDMLFNAYIRTSSKYTDFSHMTMTINRFIYDAYKDLLNSKKVKPIDVETLIKEKHFLVDKVGQKYEDELIYRQPIIYLLYYLILNYTAQTLEK